MADLREQIAELDRVATQAAKDADRLLLRLAKGEWRPTREHYADALNALTNASAGAHKVLYAMQAALAQHPADAHKGEAEVIRAAYCEGWSDAAARADVAHVNPCHPSAGWHDSNAKAAYDAARAALHPAQPETLGPVAAQDQREGVRNG